MAYFVIALLLIGDYVSINRENVYLLVKNEINLWRKEI